MKEISDRHHEALQFLAKANEDIVKAEQAILDDKFADAYGFATRVSESMRQIFEVQKDLTNDDKNK